MNSAGVLSSPLAGEERDLTRNEFSRSGEGAFDSSREIPTAPSQDLLGSLRSPSQVYLSRKGREGTPS